VRQALGSRESLIQFGVQLASTVDSYFHQLAIDRVESWLSLVAEPADTPAKLAQQFWTELSSRLRHSTLPCVLNLYGGMPQGVDLELGAGPLFHQQPLSAEREFAGAVSRELLDLFRRDAADLPNFRVDWHWYAVPDPVQTALIGNILHAMQEGHSVAIAFDREPTPLAEGLRRVRDAIRPVLDFIGVSLPLVWRDTGSPRSLPAFEAGLRQAVELAVRAAVQKREFVRSMPHRAEQLTLDRAVAAIYPIGLDWTVHQLVGKGAAEDEGALRLSETIVRYLRESAAHEARHFALGVVVDQPVQCSLAAHNSGDCTPLVADLAPVRRDVGLRRQIHAAGRLHAIAQAGTLECVESAVTLQNQQQLIDLLHWTARSSELVRLRLCTERRVHDQTVVVWPEG
jgi:hypothetical protein